MASGSPVTIDGGTDMTQITGDVIDDADFNNSTNVNLMLGNANDIH